MTNMEKIIDIFRSYDRLLWKEKITPYVEKEKHNRCYVYETDDENWDTTCCFSLNDLDPNKKFKFNVGDIVIARKKRTKGVYKIIELPILDRRVYEDYRKEYFNDPDTNKFGLYICVEGSSYIVEGFYKNGFIYSYDKYPNSIQTINTDYHFRKALFGELRWKILTKLVKKRE